MHDTPSTSHPACEHHHMAAARHVAAVYQHSAINTEAFLIGGGIGFLPAGAFMFATVACRPHPATQGRPNWSIGFELENRSLNG